MSATMLQLDERDTEILAKRVELLGAVEGPREGDFVVFADGVERRISHVWMGDGCDSVQTSKGGSFYLGNGHVSFSGSLYRGVKHNTLTLTDETRVGTVWFFHHDQHRAHNGIDTEMTFRVYECSEVAS